jgi:hypothetical protein
MDQPTRRPLRSLPQLQRILVTVLDQLAEAGTELGYRLVGTGAALLQGVPLAAAMSTFCSRVAPT